MNSVKEQIANLKFQADDIIFKAELTLKKLHPIEDAEKVKVLKDIIKEFTITRKGI